IIYGILYVTTPKLFPTKDCRAGNGITTRASGIFEIMAQLIIGLYADLAVNI
ncbi:hypothetical protein FRC10_009469, partial [Ceratobasidium sp. 414]